MELRGLELFVAVAEELHFGRAADRVHLSQSAFTQAIARLERDLGARLLDRTTRSVALTPAGRELLERAPRLLAEADATALAVRRVAHGEVGAVRLGVVGSAMIELLPALVRSLREQHPGVELVLTEQPGAAQLGDLRAGRLDLGLVHATAERPPAGVEVLGLRQERLLLALPGDHRLAHRSVLRLAELRDDPLVVIRREHEADTHQGYLDLCARAGFAARVARQVSSLQALLGFVAAGLGWAFVSESVVGELARTGVRYVRLREVAHLPTALVWPAAHPLSAPAERVRDAAAALATVAGDRGR